MVRRWLRAWETFRQQALGLHSSGCVVRPLHSSPTRLLVSFCLLSVCPSLSLCLLASFGLGLCFFVSFCSLPIMVCLGHCLSLSLSLCLLGFPHLCDSPVYPAPAFMFRLDASTSHQNLRVDDLSVEWDAMGGKVQDIKAREKDGKGRTASPVNSPAR